MTFWFLFGVVFVVAVALAIASLRDEDAPAWRDDWDEWRRY